MRRKRRCLLPRLGALALALVVLLAAQPVHAVSGPIVEHLRLKVPRQARAAWLEAETRSWEPWLRRQQGFVGRDLYWDPAAEEGVLLIRWAHRGDWEGIDPAEVRRVQQSFEAAARDALERSTTDRAARQAAGSPGANPFPLVYSGTLEPLLPSQPQPREDALPG